MSPQPDSASGALRQTLLPADISAVETILRSTGFFYDSETEVALELMRETLERGSEKSGYHFLFADIQPGRPVAYACFGPIPCTVGSWDLYWMAAHADHRGKGIGRRLLRAVEARIAELGGRRIYIETASRPLYEPTRAFYSACGYVVEATLREFYGPGDDKLTYSRALD